MLFEPQSPRPLRPDAAQAPARYRRWLAARDHWRRTTDPLPTAGPEIDLLVLVDGAPADRLTATLRSIGAQRTGPWHLSLTVVGTPEPDVDRVLGEELAKLGHVPTRVLTEPSGTPAATARAAALESTSSPACAFLDAGDVLDADAVALLSAALVDADVVYADEDRISSDGLLSAPLFKPDWSPELALAWNYVGRPVAMRVAPLVACGGLRTLPGGDWEHDLVLRVTEQTQRVAHVAEVLCHRHRDADIGAGAAGPAAVVDALRRREEDADVAPGPLPGTWHVRRRLAGRPSVSVIVPFRDSTVFLRACTDSLFATSSGVDLQLVLVDNGSTEPETATLVERLGSRRDVTVLRDDGPFNWAVINNAATASARGDVLLFMNDDVEARSEGWLELLAAQALRPQVGAVGARLVYPSGRLQHAGIVVGMTGVSGHVLAGLPPDQPGYLGMAVLTRDVSAVTGACLATRREVYDALGGFDESLWLDFNDIDYCLRARRRGLRIVYEGAAELVHHESPSRGTSASDETARAFAARWATFLEEGDPFLNANISRSDFSAALDDPDVPPDPDVPDGETDPVARTPLGAGRTPGTAPEGRGAEPVDALEPPGAPGARDGTPAAAGAAGERVGARGGGARP